MRSTLLFAAGVTLALSGCGTATQVGFSDPSARAAALERFHAGTAGKPPCGAGFDCTFKWIVAATRRCSGWPRRKSGMTLPTW